MTRIAIVVEGQTEREFVSKVLAPSLWERQVYLYPSLLGPSGGDVSVDRLAADMVSVLTSYDYVTSLVDFYGFRGKGSLTIDALEERINEEVNRRIRRPEVQRRVFAYVQSHEFEGLLFSDVSAFVRALIVPNEIIAELETVRSQFPTPEDINDSCITAPSKRIENLIPRYDKQANGFLIAQEIGLSVIRRECPRFNAWVTRLESLGVDSRLDCKITH